MDSTPDLTLSVLLIEDDASLRESLRLYLQMEGFQAYSANHLAEGEQLLSTHPIDLLILDLGLGESDGLAWLQSKRAGLLGYRGVIILTGRSDAASRVQAMQAGADSYLVKPVILQELKACLINLGQRVRLQLGYDSTPAPTAPCWKLDSDRWQLISPANQTMTLTANEMAFLQALAKQPSEIVHKNDLVVAMGYHLYGYDFRRLEVLVRRLRAKALQAILQELPLITVRGRGYAFTAPIQQ